MLPYTHFISNLTSVPNVTHGVDMPGYYRTHIFLEMTHTYYMVRYSIDIPGHIVWIYVDIPDWCKYITDCHDQHM